MPKFEEFTYPSSTGKNRIYARLCLPDGAVRGVVQIVHGIAEHIGRYEGFMLFLAQHGFAAVGEDHLGHGRSYSNEKEQGFFSEEDGWDHVVQDLLCLNRQMHEKFPGIPYIMFGHSMGSFLTRTFLIRYPGQYDLAILSGTGHQSSLLVRSGLLLSSLLCKMQGADATGERLNQIAFGSYLKRIPNARTPYDWLTTVPEVVDAYIADEKCGFVCKNSLYRDMMQGIAYITDPKNIAQMNKEKPVYFMSGAEDPVGEYGKGVEKAYKAFCDAGCKDVMIRLYPGGRHEMLNETNREQVYQDILSWIESKL